MQTKVPLPDNTKTIEQLKLNLKAIVETGKIIQSEIKRMESENEKRALLLRRMGI